MPNHLTPTNSKLLFLFLFLAIGNTLVTTPTFGASNQYCESGTFSLDTSPYYQNSLANAVAVSTFNAILSKSHPSYSAVSSINTIDFVFTASREFNLSVSVCSYAPKALTFCMLSMRLSSLNILSVRYLVLEDALGAKMNSFYSGASYYVPNQGTTPLSSSNPLVARFTVPTINMVGTTKVIVAFSGMNVTASSGSNTVDMKLLGTYEDSTTIRVDITSGSSTVLNVGSIMFCIIGYNVQDAMAWPFPAVIINSGVFDTSTPYMDTNSTFKTYNTFWGLSYVKSKNHNDFTCDSSLTANVAITGVTADSTAQWVSAILVLKYCDPTTPYYLQSQDKCYDLCPNLYYQDTTNMLCKSCTNYACLKCSMNGSCTTCDPSRTLNSVTGTCDPGQGYFESGSLAASPCDPTCYTCSLSQSNCTSCSSAHYLSGKTCLPCDASCATCSIVSSNCTTCYSASYLSGSLCQPCVSNCNICSNSLNCGTCNSGYMTDAGGLCIISYDCASIAYCASCAAATGCVTCSTGYQNQSITSCVSVCGDGVLSPQEQCDDGANLAGDGCSATCTIEQAYFCTGGVGSLSTCTKCLTNCMNCTNLLGCSLCNTLYVWNLSSSGCIPNCSNVTNCLNCFVGAGILNCTGCQVGYKVDTAICLNICGDGLIVGAEQCDDNNTISGDGCSNSCTIEDGFACSSSGSLSTCTQCVGATFQSLNKLLCLPCANYDCATCQANGNCLSCGNSSNRYLSNLTHRCVPFNGFYDDGSHQTAATCDASCSTCNAGGNSSCLSCYTGYVLLSNSCQACTSVLDSNCISCKNSVVFVAQCSSCNTGYIIKNNTCVFACGDSQINNGEECDDGNLVSGDGCSSSCFIQNGFSCKIVALFSICTECIGATFQSANKSVCLPCANFDCATCKANGNCLSCSNTSNRYLDNVTNRCLPLDGYYSFGQYEIAFPCDSQCLTCSAAGNKSCLSCHQNYILVLNICQSCNAAVGTNCLSCSFSGSKIQCLTCLNGTLQNGVCVIVSTSVQKDMTITQSNSKNLLLYIIPALGALLLCCCCLILLCLWRRRKNDQNKVQQQNQEELKDEKQENKSKLDQTINVFHRDQIFSQKEAFKKKNRNRTEKSNDQSIKINKKRNHTRQQTQENVLSLQQFRESNQFKKSQKGKNNKRKANNFAKDQDEFIESAYMSQIKVGQFANAPLSENRHNPIKQQQAIVTAPEQPEPINGRFEDNDFDDGSKKSEIHNEDDIQGIKNGIKENSKAVDDGEKSEIHNQDYNKAKIKEDMSESGETKQNNQSQETSEKGR